jgi:hypothetical protein
MTTKDSDGNLYTTYPDGRESKAMANGDTWFSDPNGNETIYKQDGTVGRRSHSGVMTWHYSDGATVQKNPDGSILKTDGQGHTSAGDESDWDGDDLFG